MNPSHLRIGNLVFLNDDKGRRASHLTSVGAVQSFVKAEDGEEVLCGNEMLEGVGLTAEWVEKLGLKKEYSRNVAYIINCGEYVLSVVRNGFSDDKWWFSLKTMSEGQNITIVRQYVHQLQNLYWCLCGEELEVKQSV